MKAKFFLPVILIFIVVSSFSVPGKQPAVSDHHRAVKPPTGTYVGWCTAVWEDVAVDFDVYVDMSTGDVVSAMTTRYSAPPVPTVRLMDRGM